MGNKYPKKAKTIETSLQNEVKILMIGDAGVGKSSTICREVTGVFIEEYDPASCDWYRKIFTIDGLVVLVEFQEYIGCEMYEINFNIFDAIYFIYSIDSPKSFNNVKYYHRMVQKHIDIYSIPYILVGNKEDLAQDKEERSIQQNFYKFMDEKMDGNHEQTNTQNNVSLHNYYITEILCMYSFPKSVLNIIAYYLTTDSIENGQVKIKDGIKLAKELSCPFMETSAKTSKNISEAYNILLSQYLRNIEQKRKGK